MILFDERETLPEELNLDLCFVTKYLSNNLDNDELSASIYPRPGLRPVEAILVSTPKDQILTKQVVSLSCKINATLLDNERYLTKNIFASVHQLHINFLTH